MLFLKLLGSAVLLFNLPFGVSACSCTEKPVSIPIKSFGLGIEDSWTGRLNDQLVFEGILVDVKQDTSKREKDYELVFEMVDNFKGECIEIISVWTNHTGGGCGFRAKVGSYSIVHAAYDSTSQIYYAYRADCWAGVSEFNEPDRFKQYRQFLISYKYEIDGHYKFSQRLNYWPINVPTSRYTDCVEYTIRNGLLDGEWKVINRAGELVERGFYKKGIKVGEWIYLKQGTAYNPETLQGYSKAVF